MATAEKSISRDYLKMQPDEFDGMGSVSDAMRATHQAARFGDRHPFRLRQVHNDLAFEAKHRDREWG